MAEVIIMVVCNLAQIALEKRTNITKIAVEAGVNRDTLSRLVNSRIKGLEFTTITALCSYLKVGINDLFTVYPFDISKIEFDFGDSSIEGQVSVEWIMYSPRPSKNYFEASCTLVQPDPERFDLYIDVVDSDFLSCISSLPPLALNSVKRQFELAFSKHNFVTASLTVSFGFEEK